MSFSSTCHVQHLLLVLHKSFLKIMRILLFPAANVFPIIRIVLDVVDVLDLAGFVIADC
jgi:hypothetical protein